MSVAEAKIVLTAEDRTKAAFNTAKKGLAEVNELASAAGLSFAALGAAGSIAGMVAMVKRINDSVDALNDLKDATGASIENISGLEDVADRFGHNFESAGQILVKFNQALTQTIRPGSDAEKVLKAIGLNARELREIDPAQALLVTAKALNQFADDGEKARAMQLLFGRSVKEAAPFLKDLAEQGELNAKVTTQQAEEAEKFNRQLTVLQTSAKDLGRDIAMSLVPALNGVLKNFREIKELGSLDLVLKDAAKDLLTLGMGNVRMTGDHGGDINRILEERAELERQLARAREDGRGMHVRTLQEDIFELNRYLEVLRLKQRNAVLGGDTGDVSDALSRRLSSSIPKVVLPDEPDTKAIAAAKKELQDQAKVLADLRGLTVTFTEDWERLNRMYATGSITLGELEVAQGALLKQQPAIKQAAEDRMRWIKAEAETMQQWAEDVDKAYADASKAREQYSMQTLQESQSLAEANEQLDLEAKLIGATTRQRQVAIEHLRIEQKLRKDLWDLEHNPAFAGSPSLDIERQRLIDNAARAKANAERRAEVEQMVDLHQEQIDLLKQTDEIARDVFVSIASQGEDAFEAIGKSIKANVINMLYQMTLRPFVIQLAGSVLGASDSAISQAIGGNSLFGKASGAASMYNAGSSLFGGGLTAPGSAYYGFATSGLGQSLGLSNATAIAGNNISAFAPAGTQLTGLGSAMPYIGAAIAIASLLSGNFKGETRVGGQYWNTDFQAGPSGGAIPGATDAIGATMTAINASLAGLDATTRLERLVSGLEQSEKGKGFAYAGAWLTGGMAVGQGTDGMGWQNRRGSMTSEQAMAAFGEELMQVRLEVIQASDAVGPLADYVRSLGDISALSSQQLQEAIGRVDKALTERAALEDRLFALTASEAEQLARARDRERAAIDSTNRALLDQIYAIEDQRRANELATIAAEEAARAQEEMAQAQRQYAEEMQSQLLDAYGDLQDVMQGVIDKNNAYAQSLRAVRLNLTTGPGALLSPEARYMQTGAEFRRLSALPVGDEERLEKLAEAGAAFAEASQQYNASSMQYFADRDEIVRAVEASEIHAKANVDVAQLQLNAARSQLTELGLIKAGVTTLAQAQAAFNAAMQAYLAAQTTAHGGGMTPAQAAAQAAQWGIPADRIVNTPNGSYIGPMTPQLPPLTPQQSADIWSGAGMGSAAALYASNGASTPTAEGMQYWQDRLNSGESYSSVMAAFNASVAYVNGSHRNGLTSVPFDGYRAELHQGERVLTASQARAADETAALMRQLVNENRALRQEMATVRTVLASYAQRDLNNGEQLVDAAKRGTDAALLASSKAVPA